MTGLCYILKFLKQLQIPKQSLLGNFWIARTVNTLPALEPLIKNESRNSMSFNNWSNIVVVYQSNQMIKSLISGVLYFSKIESLQDSKELYKTGQTCTLSHGWHTAESSLIITSKWLWNKKKVSRTRKFKNCMGCNFSEILTAVVSGVATVVHSSRCKQSPHR